MIESLSYPYDWSVISRKSKQIRRSLLEVNQKWVEKRIAVLGGTTTFEITKTLDLFCLSRGVKATFWESDYGLYFEDLVFGNPDLLKFKADLIYVHTTNRNISRWPVAGDSEEQVTHKLESEWSKLTALWSKAHELGYTIIQNNFELPFERSLGQLDCVAHQGKTRFILELNRRISEYARSHPSFIVNDIHYLSARIGLQNWTNHELWQSYKYSVSYQAIPELCSQLSAIIGALFGKTKKALILDLDNTLWGGVIGDDGVGGIQIGNGTPIGESFSRFQHYLRELKSRGILLAVCSKNDEGIAKEGFTHEDSVLKLEDFVEFYANWDPKSQNISKIIRSLNLVEDSFVYMDDSSFEQAEVRRSFALLTIPQIGENASRNLEVLDRSGFFEPISLLEEDLKRSEMYVTEKRRVQFGAEFTDQREFLKSLEMMAEIGPVEDLYLDRVVQLINKTNQFNLTNRRYSSEDVVALIGGSDSIHLNGRLVDKFGDSGITTVIIGKGVDPETVEIDTWLMSCRVFKRGLEYALFDQFMKYVKARNIAKVVGTYSPTAKNKIVSELYLEFGFKKTEVNQDGTVLYELDVSNYRAQEYFIDVKGKR